MLTLKLRYSIVNIQIFSSGAVFKPGISVLGPRGPYHPKSWGHLKKSGDSIINDQNFIENVPVAFRCVYFAPCNLFL